MSDIQAAFTRHRRSLILISLVLSVVLVYGLEGSEVRLAPGTGSVTVDFKDPQVIVMALWVVWVWFFYRYWQHFRMIRADMVHELKTAQTYSIINGFRTTLKGQASRMAERKILDGHPKAKSVEWANEEESREPTRDGWKRVYAKYKFQGVITFDDNTKQNSQWQIHNVEISGWKLYPRLIRAILPVNIWHRYFTEYWTAFVFGIAPLVVKFGVPAYFNLLAELSR